MVGIVRDVDGVTRNEIVSGTAEKLIVAPLTGDIVIAALAVDDVAAASASHPVGPRACINRVRAAVHRVGFPGKGLEHSTSGALSRARRLVVIEPIEALRHPVGVANKVVVARAADEQVGARAACKNIVVSARYENVIAGLP